MMEDKVRERHKNRVRTKRQMNGEKEEDTDAERLNERERSKMGQIGIRQPFSLHLPVCQRPNETELRE